MAAKKASKPGKPTIDFSSIAKGLKNLEDKNHITQIGPSMADAYIQIAKYKDEKGREMYKTKFNEEEAGKLGDALYDKLVYHAHRRLFDIDEAKYKGLLDIKNAQGVPYVDAVVSHYFNLERSQLRNSLKDMALNEDDINHTVLEDLLKDNVQHHRGVITGQVVRDLKPTDMNAIKSEIKGLVEKHKLDPKIYKRAERTTDFRELMNQYVNVARQFYQEEPKKP